MITGIGMDLIEVDRIQSKIDKEMGFRELVFSAREIAYCEKQAHKYEHYAARFAAKEAFLKALGTGWINGTAFHEIEISGDDAGKPELQLLGQTAGTLQSRDISRIWVTLTHLKAIGAAVVIIENT